MTEKRFNCHVKFSAMPNGIMVLDYERHGDEQTVIEDISREKAHRVMDRLNELNDENEQLKRQIGNLEHTKDFCAEVCADCERLEKENERLKEEINSKNEIWRRMDKMTQNKRFNIKLSMMVMGKDVIIDELGQYTFPVLEPTMSHMFCKALNELNDEKEIAIEGIKVANDLINRYGGDELKYKWKKEVNVND